MKNNMPLKLGFSKVLQNETLQKHYLKYICEENSVKLTPKGRTYTNNIKHLDNGIVGGR